MSFIYRLFYCIMMAISWETCDFMTEETNNNNAYALTKSVVRALDDLPLLARLEFVRNIILNRGGDEASTPQDSVLVTATKVLNGTIEILRAHPQAAGLRTPEPQ
jgi:hypothetical protein